MNHIISPLPQRGESAGACRVNNGELRIVPCVTGFVVYTTAGDWHPQARAFSNITALRHGLRDMLARYDAETKRKPKKRSKRRASRRAVGA